MLTAASNPRAWAVATALAAASGLDWAAWARGEFAHVHMVPFYPDDGFPLSEGWCIGPNDGKSTLYTSEERARAHAVPAPWDADAYRADVARRGVEPGPMPSLSWTGEDGFGWSVHADKSGVWVDFVRDGAGVAEWMAARDGVFWDYAAGGVPRELVARIVTLATAAKRAMGGP